MKDRTLVEVVLESFQDPAPTSLSSVTSKELQWETVARLWAGMGYVYRVRVAGRPDRIVKHVRLPSPQRGLSRGDQRKSDSYHTEANFYEFVVPVLRTRYGVVDLPETYHVRRTPHAIFIVMSYIAGSSATHQRPAELESLTPTRTRLVLDWLARFHAATWQTTSSTRNNQQQEETPWQQGQRLLQKPMGTYWHLDTRPDEHASMSNKGLEGRLKLAARAIHDRLQRDPCQCLVHGDVKEANLLFTRDEASSGEAERVVLCDFQYCGPGTPSQDLAYFFCSSIEDWDDEGGRRQDVYVSYYLGQLTAYLPPTAKPPSLAALQDSLDWAYCDFQRFMCGWGTWGNDLTARVRRKLHTLDGGKNLGSEEAYSAAMLANFGGEL
jgi:aminoglycoside phosphotransferase (APT) family kinase protein